MGGLSSYLGTIIIFLSEFLWEYPVHHRLMLGSACSIILAGAITGWGLYERQKSYELTHIIPGSGPTPQGLSCESAKGEMLISLGSVLALVEKFPANVIIMGYDESGLPYPILQIGRIDGRIGIQTLRIYNSSGDIITRFNADKIWTNNNIRVERPNSHSILVYDNEDTLALKMDWVNEHYLRVSGIFRRPGMPDVRVTRNAILLGSNSLSGGCMKISGSGGGLLFIR